VGRKRGNHVKNLWINRKTLEYIALEQRPTSTGNLGKPKNGKTIKTTQNRKTRKKHTQKTQKNKTKNQKQQKETINQKNENSQSRNNRTARSNHPRSVKGGRITLFGYSNTFIKEAQS